MSDHSDDANHTPRSAAVLRGAVFDDDGGVITPPMSQMTPTPPVGTRKPEPAIYQHVLMLLDLPAENVIFVDDLQANLDGAAALAIRRCS